MLSGLWLIVISIWLVVILCFLLVLLWICMLFLFGFSRLCLRYSLMFSLCKVWVIGLVSFLL